MRSLLSAFIVLLLIHLIAATGFVGWLAASDRLNGERLAATVDLYRPTITARARTLAEAQAAEDRAAAVADELARLERAARGPKTLAQRLASNRADEAFDRLRLERLAAERDAIFTRLEQDKAAIAADRADLEAREAAFQRRVATRTAELQGEDFRRAVDSLQSLPPKQAKGVVQQYLDRGEEAVAVDYLAAMPLRKSGAILKAFKGDADLPAAAGLIERLRTRSDAARAAAAGSDATADAR